MAKNILTVDLEDWYQSSTELFRRERGAVEVVYPSARVIANTEKLLALLEKYKVQATFFVLGTVAERYPDLVKKIADLGHELASHGYGHRLLYDLTEKEFREDIERSLELLAKITSRKIKGYRAPYFSLTRSCAWAFKVLLDYGFEYDSSVFMMARKRCGFLDYEKYLAEANLGREKKLLEFPSSSVVILGQPFPICGGAPLRVFPLFFHQWGVRQFNKKGQPALMYIHPYELDYSNREAFQETVGRKGFWPKWVNYTQNFNRSTIKPKVEALLKSHSFTSTEKFLLA